jgi:hypothetical protein
MNNYDFILGFRKVISGPTFDASLNCRNRTLYDYCFPEPTDFQQQKENCHIFLNLAFGQKI